MVSNPGANAVTVAFDVFGRGGPVAAAEGRSVSIPPRERVVVSLDALAPGEPAPAVHVIATGGVVSAVLSDQWIDGATARGIDDSVPAAAPATTQVRGRASTWRPRLAAPRQPHHRRGGARAGDGPDGAGSAANRPSCGPSACPPGATTDVPLALSAGAYGLRISSDRPVTAAAWTERRAATADRMGDFAWLPATAPHPRGGRRRPCRRSMPRTQASAPVGRPPGGHRRGPDRDGHRAAHRPGHRRARLDGGRRPRPRRPRLGGDAGAATCERPSRSSAPTPGVPQVAAVPLTTAPVTSLSVPVRQVGS